MNVILTNTIIFTPVNLTILIMAENVLAVVVPPPPASKLVDQSLAWIGFGNEGNCNNIRDEGGLEAFDNFVGLTVIDIRDMASGFSKSTTAQGRINFGTRRVNYTLGIINWDQYKSRCSCTESLTGISDAEEYKDLLGIALDCATLWKVKAKQADTINKAGDPVKFKDERTWPEWEVKFENNLFTIPGVNCVLL